MVGTNGRSPEHTSKVSAQFVASVDEKMSFPKIVKEEVTLTSKAVYVKLIVESVKNKPLLIVEQYTIEEINELKTYKNHAKIAPVEQRAQELADYADITTDYAGFELSRKIKDLVKDVNGEHNLYCSCVGHDAWDRIKTIFGGYLSADTEKKLAKKIRSEVGFLDTTAEFHEGMNGFFNHFFTTVSGQRLKRLNSYQTDNPALRLHLSTAKRIANIDVNVEFAKDVNAPEIIRLEAKKALFDMVAVEMMGLTLTVGIKAVTVVRTYFNLDNRFGALRSPHRDNPLKPIEVSDGVILKHPNLQRLEAGESLNLEKGNLYIWAIDKDGVLLVAKDTGLGHPTLVGNAGARVAGEIRFNEVTKEWRILDESGRYSRGRHPIERNRILKNVQQRFNDLKLESPMGVRLQKVRK